MKIHRGECFCGTVKLEVSGDPEAMGYCHCQSCRSWSAAPINAFTLWKPDAVRITTGSEHVATFQKTPLSERQYCKKCGGHLMTNHPSLGLVNVYAATLTHIDIQTRPPHQLRPYRSAGARRVAKAKRFSRRVRRIWRADA